VIALSVPPGAGDFGEVAGLDPVVGVFMPGAPGPAEGSGGVAAAGPASACAASETGLAGWGAMEAVRSRLPLVLVLVLLIALGGVWSWVGADDGDWPLEADRTPGAGAAEFVPPALARGESAVPVDGVRESPLEFAALLGSTLAAVLSGAVAALADALGGAPSGPLCGTLAGVLCVAPAAPLCVGVSAPSDPAEVAEDREATSAEELERALSGRASGLLAGPTAAEAPCESGALALLDVRDAAADTLSASAEPLETA
jgi:hypothetical protein